MKTPWPTMLRLAVLRFGMTPEAFWRLSLSEWRALAGGEAGETMGRAGLEALMGAYPDEEVKP